MSYQISYVPEMDYKYPKQRKISAFTTDRVLVLVIIFLLFLSVAVRPVRNWIFPGDPKTTEAAVEKMQEALHDGKSVTDAVTVFCLEVLTGENQD